MQDESVGFQTISAEDIDDYGVKNIIKRIRERVGTGPVYLSLDIDVIDPGLAPASKPRQLLLSGSLTVTISWNSRSWRLDNTGDEEDHSGFVGVELCVRLFSFSHSLRCLTVLQRC